MINWLEKNFNIDEVVWMRIGAICFIASVAFVIYSVFGAIEIITDIINS